MGYITKLQAINDMLLAAGENMVADLEDDSGIDTGIAETVLERVSTNYQLMGLAQNKVVRKFVPNGDGKILLPQNDYDEDGLLSADLVSMHVNSDGYRLFSRVYEASPVRLWNITDDTDVWETDDYYVELIKKLKWEHLSTASQMAVLAEAQREYQILTLGDEAADAYLQNKAVWANSRAKAHNVANHKQNILDSCNMYIHLASKRVNPMRYYSGINSRFYPGGY